MPRLNVAFGPGGPIIEVRLQVGDEDAERLVADGSPIPPRCCVAGLVDTGAERTAIERSLLDWLGLSACGSVDLSSSVLGYEVRKAKVYRVQMTFGSLEAPNPPKWRTISAVGVTLVFAEATVLIGRDLLATCRFTDDGRKSRFMMSY